MTRSCFLLAVLLLPLAPISIVRAQERTVLASLDRSASSRVRVAELEPEVEEPPLRLSVIDDAALPRLDFEREFSVAAPYSLLHGADAQLRMPTLMVGGYRPRIEWSPARAAAQRMMAKNPMLASLRGVSKAMEVDEQRRQKALTASELEKSSDAQALILTGDIAGAATMAASFLSLHLNLCKKRHQTGTPAQGDAEAKPRVSLGLGLGRLGLRLRSEF